VLADVDVSLSSWLSTALPEHTKIEFGSPADLVDVKPRKHGLLNLFLYSVDEDTDGLPANDIRLRDENGRVSTVVLPVRRYALTYQVTAWAGDVLEEHRLLGAVLIAHAGHDALGPHHLRGSLSVVDVHVPIHIGAGRRPAVWDSLGMPMRTSLELTAFVPVVPVVSSPPAPPAENLDLEARRVPGDPSSSRATRRWKRTSLSEP
jgi:hypothetical protein